MLLKVFFSAFIFIILTCIGPMHAYAKSDREFVESKKCSDVFSYFERRYKIPKDVLYSISLQETNRPHSKHNISLAWPWTVTVNPEGRGYYFDSQKAAIAFAKQQIAQGKNNIDVGCMQINLKYHPEAFSSIEHAFSPRQNIAYGARFLKEKYEKYRNWNKAIGAYHSGHEQLGSQYSKNVYKISKTILEYKKRLSDFYNLKNSTLASNNKRNNLGTGKVRVNVGQMKQNNLFRKASKN